MNNGINMNCVQIEETISQCYYCLFTAALSKNDWERKKIRIAIAVVYSWAV